MRVLVTGGTGLLGWWIARILRAKGYTVFASYHEKRPIGLSEVKWVRINLEEYESSLQAVKSIRPDVLIHSAAYTDVDGCETNRRRAYSVNYMATKTLTGLCRDTCSYVVYVSTDYVFDGNRGLYREDDIPYPVNFYGLTKLLGEIAITSARSDGFLVVRVSGLYGYTPTGKRNFGIMAMERLLRGQEVYAFTDQFLSPTYVRFLAEKIATIVEKKPNGILHLAGERLSRYQFALMLASELKVDTSLVRPASIRNARFTAKRPLDSSLDTSKAAEMGLKLPDTRTSIRDFIRIYQEMKAFSREIP